MPKYFYSGDMSIEHGGMYYTLEGHAIRVTPASDAGGPDNVFWIEELEFDLEADATDALKSADLPTDTTYLPERICAMAWYGQYDCHHLYTIRIGPVCPFTGHREGPQLDLILRGGTDLRKWVRRHLSRWL